MMVVSGWVGIVVRLVHLWEGQGGQISSWVGHGGAMVSDNYDNNEGPTRGGMRLQWSHG